MLGCSAFSHWNFKFLSAVCDNQREHAPWGLLADKHRVRFATSEEAEYPALLCSRIADAILQAAQTFGCQALEPAPKRARLTLTTAAQKMAAAGRQPRGNKFPRSC